MAHLVMTLLKKAEIRLKNKKKSGNAPDFFNKQILSQMPKMI